MKWPWSKNAQDKEPVVVGTPTNRVAFEHGSATWAFVALVIASEIETLRKKNDIPQDAEKTALIRGEIRALKKLANLPERINTGRLSPDAPQPARRPILAGSEDENE